MKVNLILGAIIAMAVVGFSPAFADGFPTNPPNVVIYTNDQSTIAKFFIPVAVDSSGDPTGSGDVTCTSPGVTISVNGNNRASGTFEKGKHPVTCTSAATGDSTSFNVIVRENKAAKYEKRISNLENKIAERQEIIDRRAEQGKESPNQHALIEKYRDAILVLESRIERTGGDKFGPKNMERIDLIESLQTTLEQKRAERDALTLGSPERIQVEGEINKIIPRIDRLQL